MRDKQLKSHYPLLFSRGNKLTFCISFIYSAIIVLPIVHVVNQGFWHFIKIIFSFTYLFYCAVFLQAFWATSLSIYTKFIIGSYSAHLVSSRFIIFDASSRNIFCFTLISHIFLQHPLRGYEVMTTVKWMRTPHDICFVQNHMQGFELNMYQWRWYFDKWRVLWIKWLNRNLQNDGMFHINSLRQ